MSEPATDVVLIGAGIMSATLGTLLKELEPSLSISILEVLSDCALESSGSWNNAGTGHAANCELNYTPQRPDGSVDISRALEVNTEFDISRQLWAYLVRKGAIADPRDFIHPCPHMSFVWGDANVAFLKARFKAMSANHCYRGMEYSESHAEIGAWAPLIMEGRAADQPVAATRIITGTDVDYGALTHLLFDHLAKQPGVNLSYRHRVRNLQRTDGGRWLVEVEDIAVHTISEITAKFVFIGAGGGALELLQKSDIPEGHGYGGFPVSGIWLRCDAQQVVERHDAKVYGKAALGSPPMSVPHLDRRVIGGKTSLLFGPYAGFTTRIPETWLAHRSVPRHRTEQHPSHARRGARQCRSLRIPDWPGAAEQAAPVRRVAEILRHRRSRRLAACRCWGAGARSSSRTRTTKARSNSAPN